MLEAMAEKQVTAGRKTYPLPKLFLVMATQNPIEQEGTYPLPEAQLDRFLLHLDVAYPDMESELAILRLNRGEAQGQALEQPEPMPQQAVFEARQEVLNVHMAESIEQYIVRLVMATRQPEKYSPQLAQWLEMGLALVPLLRLIAARVLTHGCRAVTMSLLKTYKRWPSQCCVTVYYVATTHKLKVSPQIR